MWDNTSEKCSSWLLVGSRHLFTKFELTHIPGQKKGRPFPQWNPKRKSRASLWKQAGNLEKCTMYSQMIFYSETDGPKPGGTLAIPLSPLTKGAYFHLLRLLHVLELKQKWLLAPSWQLGKKTGSRKTECKPWIKVLLRRLAGHIHGIPSVS